MSFPRPVPTIGDPSSAAERASAPDAWAMPDAVEALARVVGARRDIRRFRPDPVPETVLRSVLEAGHRGPSVGHSQPWRFIVVTEAATRDRAAVMADRSRLRQAEGMTEQAARGLLDLRLEGIREAPVGIVMACDRRAPAAGVLGRASFPDADLWSCAAAIENIWLTARVHGLGLGWVTLFEPAQLAALLGLPDGVETLGWLCLGWPDERPPEPGLERAGWSKRLPLDAVVMRERWTDSAAPVSHLRSPEQSAVVAARDRADDLLTAPGSLGSLDVVLDRIGALSPAAGPGTLVIAGSDHAVTRHGVSAFDASVTADVARATHEGTSMGAVAARAAGLELLFIDAGIGCCRGDLVYSDALDHETWAALLAEGRRRGAEAAASGLVAIGEVGVGNTTVAATLAAALLDLPASDVAGRGSSADAAMLERKTDVVERAIRRVGPVGADEAVRRLGGGEFAVLTGVVLGVAEAGGVVVLDGLATSVCALVAIRLEPGVAAHLVAGQRSREPAHALVLRELGVEPVLDLRIRAGEGVGAALAVGVLHDALRLRREVARTTRS
ncbi:5,6-dimethylbenzimidazole synthase [Humibacillus sp. DSM 29435]|uniref:5,6-dimethylbenzimidazole synthase n=1 Tax=Humibacillus sp. DSM 29435 TaxID=1869167 RepID=UPI0008722EB4|nr:5,6-dimethylbenzimidazole synthase [Humibacillus sp. DSM 29435]OFE16290.1 5,6-dimethylbenzimidazole synthase [Humibacillus sp. DSM 29435]